MRDFSRLSLKRKQPGDMPSRPPPSKIHIISDVVVHPPVAQPQELGTVGDAGGGIGQAANLHQQSSPPVLHVNDRDFEPENPDVMAILEELERTTAQGPKLNTPAPAPQPTGGPGAGASNLEPDGGANHSSQYSIPFVPPLLSPLPGDDVDDVVFIDEPTSSSSSSLTKGATTNTTFKKHKNPPKKGGEGKKGAPILRGALQETRGHEDNNSNDSDLECFSQSSERDALKETAKIFRRAREVVQKETSYIEGIDAEIKKLKERLAYLEEKKTRHQKTLDKASKKLRAVEAIFKLD